MTTVRLHLKAQITSKACALCGARLDRSELDHWWLRNTWTSSVTDYHPGEGCWPGDWFEPCSPQPESSRSEI